LAREAEEAKKKAARLAAQQAAQDDMMSDEGDESNITDDDGGRRLTQDARPARKASKKALEEMNRETQRLSRNLQLAHEAKTKKKIAKSTLFERFNFKPQGDVAENKPPPSSSRPTSPVSPNPIDAAMGDADTPPSSPPSVGKGSDLEKPGQVMEGNLMTTDNGELLSGPVSLEAVIKKRLDKGKGKATTVDLEDQTKPLPKVKRSVRVKLPTIHANLVTLGSDDELDVQPARKTRIDAIFARAPTSKTNESRSLHALRLLAQVNDPEKRAATGKNAKPGMTSGELHVDLQQRARQQAKLERDRRLELLKAKGIHVQTQEEREQEMAEVEDIVARARAEAEEIMTREREAAKKEKREKRAAGELDPLAWDDSDSDDEYEEGQEVEEVELELSGSEDEHEDAEMKSDEEAEDEAGDEGDDEEAEDASAKGLLFDGEAESTGESEDGGPDELDGEVDSDAEDVPAPNKPGRRPKKHVTIISDDESDDPVEATPRPKTAYPKSPSAPKTVSPKVPTSVLRSATKTFIPGLPVAGPAGLGLTQIFAGTMDDSQLDPGCASPSQMMPSFNQFPDSNFSQSVREPAEDMMILDSQPTQNATTQDRETQGIQIRFSQSQMHGFDSLLQDNNATQLSEFIEPTQDEGFRKFTPLKQRFVEPPMSTMSTVALGSLPEEMPIDSPLVQKAGKLRRRSEKAAVPAEPSEDEAEAMEELDGDEFGFGTTAFSVMKDAAAKEKKRKAKEAFDKKKSKAREVVDEQAEESEDEYAGLGGADGEASSDDDAASVHEMIDDETKGNEAESAKLAAFYA
jgi:mediator of replication checkpoint protein 1